MTDSLADAATKETVKKTRFSALKFYETFWRLQNGEELEDRSDDRSEEGDGSDHDVDGDNAAIKAVSGTSSLDADGGSCGPGDDAFCVSNFLWLGAACLLVYYMDFIDVAVLSPLRGEGHLNTTFYVAGLFLLTINFSIFYYLVVYLSWNRGVKSEHWDSYIPRAVPVATASFVGATLFLSIGLWPRWSVLTVPILSTVFMGVIVVISMGSQIYKWRRFVSRSKVEKKVH